SVVLQEPLLFSGTVADNIRYGRLDASLDDVVQAAIAANAHEFIMDLPDQYDTLLGENGTALSGGERQRICVARAFLKDAPILIPKRNSTDWRATGPKSPSGPSRLERGPPSRLPPIPSCWRLGAGGGRRRWRGQQWGARRPRCGSNGPTGPCSRGSSTVRASR